MFLFSCYTGLAYVDAAKLTKDANIKGGDGATWTIMDRTKTGVMANIPFLPQAEKIIYKYNDHPKVLITGKLLPLISKQKVNVYLKQISVLRGITKQLSHHCAHHTIATTGPCKMGFRLKLFRRCLVIRVLSLPNIMRRYWIKKVASDMKKVIGVFYNVSLIFF